MEARTRFFSESTETSGLTISEQFESYRQRQRSSSQGNEARIHVSSIRGSNRNINHSKYGKPLYKGSAPDMTDENYNMQHKNKGKVVIFVHEHFDEQEQRQGANADVDNLLDCLPILGFEIPDITVHRDLTLSEITEQLSKLSMENFENSDCLMVFVLTHGERDDKIYARDTDYTVDKIWKPFIGEKCMGLTGKPKIFFIVACRGSKTDSGIMVQPRRKMSTTTDASPIQKSVTFSIPVNADMLTIFSTVQGYYSYREPDRGTWFVEAFNLELKRLAEIKTKINLTKLLECVNRRMAQSYMTYNPQDMDIHQMKQCSSYTSTLTRTVYMTLDRNKIKFVQ